MLPEKKKAPVSPILKWLSYKQRDFAQRYSGPQKSQTIPLPTSFGWFYFPKVNNVWNYTNWNKCISTKTKT